MIRTATSPIRWTLTGVGLRASSLSDALIVGPLLVIASVARLVYLWDIPRFTDESDEALRAIAILHGKMLPLTNVDAYIGPLWNYLLAGVFLVAGPSLFIPRTVVAVLAILTVIPTYLLGCAVGGRWAGAIGAAFLALSPAHIVVNGHIGWSNCVTPLFTTLALWLTVRAGTSGSPARLAWAGIPWGLALQSHPTAALFGPAVALWVVVGHRDWLRSRWLWLTIALALLACSPLLVANLRSGLGGLQAGLAVQRQYSGGESLTLDVYARRLTETLYLMSDSLGGALAEFGSLSGPFSAPLGLILWVAALNGLEVVGRRQSWLLLVALATYVLLLPAINARFEPLVPKARYIAPLLPICYVAIGVFAVHLFRMTDRLRTDRPWQSLWQRVVLSPARVSSLTVLAKAAVIIGMAVLLLAPLIGLQAYYRDDLERGRTNRTLYESLAAINSARRPGETVFLDRGLFSSYTPGGGQVYSHYRLAASVFGWARQSVIVPDAPDQPTPNIRGLLVVFVRDEPAALASYRVEEIAGGQLPDSPAHIYRVLGPARYMAGS